MRADGSAVVGMPLTVQARRIEMGTHCYQKRRAKDDIKRPVRTDDAQKTDKRRQPQPQRHPAVGGLPDSRVRQRMPRAHPQKRVAIRVPHQQSGPEKRHGRDKRPDHLGLNGKPRVQSKHSQMHDQERALQAHERAFEKLETVALEPTAPTVTQRQKPEAQKSTDRRNDHKRHSRRRTQRDTAIRPPVHIKLIGQPGQPKHAERQSDNRDAQDGCFSSDPQSRFPSTFHDTQPPLRRKWNLVI